MFQSGGSSSPTIISLWTEESQETHGTDYYLQVCDKEGAGKVQQSCEMRPPEAAIVTYTGSDSISKGPGERQLKRQLEGSTGHRRPALLG